MFSNNYVLELRIDVYQLGKDSRDDANYLRSLYTRRICKAFFLRSSKREDCVPMRGSHRVYRTTRKTSQPIGQYVKSNINILNRV